MNRALGALELSCSIEKAMPRSHVPAADPVVEIRVKGVKPSRGKALGIALLRWVTDTVLERFVKARRTATGLFGERRRGKDERIGATVSTADRGSHDRTGGEEAQHGSPRFHRSDPVFTSFQLYTGILIFAEEQSANASGCETH